MLLYTWSYTRGPIHVLLFMCSYTCAPIHVLLYMCSYTYCCIVPCSTLCYVCSCVLYIYIYIYIYIHTHTRQDTYMLNMRIELYLFAAIHICTCAYNSNLTILTGIPDTCIAVMYKIALEPAQKNTCMHTYISIHAHTTLISNGRFTDTYIPATSPRTHKIALQLVKKIAALSPRRRLRFRPPFRQYRVIRKRDVCKRCRSS